MNLKRIGNSIFIICTLAFAGWMAISPTPPPMPVVVFMVMLCAAFLIMIFWPRLRRRSR
ncbi:hypothetical protein [Streptosporangium sandarakinum]|uniref:hypothetical protein n=1 Tax=Streptosporangium sandarakinum TaxID=1260955 RepID=UPI0037970EDA